MDYLTLLAQDESACRPTLRRTLEWVDDEDIGDLIPDPGSRVPQYEWVRARQNQRVWAAPH